MDIMDKAKELGQMIVDSQQMANYNEAELALENNEEAKQLLADYRQKQLVFVKESKADLSQEEITQNRENIQKEYEKLRENKIVDAYIRAKSEMDKLVKTVNDVIMYTITGEEGCNSGKCNSCSSGCK